MFLFLNYKSETQSMTSSHCTMRFRQWRIGIRVFGTFALILWPFKYFRQIYLSFYPHPNISDRFPSHFIFVGTKRTLINKDFGTFALILWASKYFICPRWKNLVKIFVNSYFSDFEPIFLLFGGVCSKSDFSKKKFFLREGFFETNLDLNKHPQQVF